MTTKRSLRGVVAGAAAALLTVLAAPTTWAGDPANYPEFPYPVTRYDEPNRGQFHFSSRGGWLNDVNAPIYYRGTWHLFYQHNPHGLEWNTMHWGHATSTDLVRWRQEPIALEPGVHPGTLFSGGGIVDSGNVTGLKEGDDDPIVVFSNTDGVSIYYSVDGAKTFRAYKAGEKVVTMGGESRDPQVVWDAASKAWVMTVWSNDGGNGVNFYRSTNLLDWQFTSRYAADWLFECPQLQPMTVAGTGETKWVLNDASMQYVVGDFRDGAFTTTWQQPQWLNTGESGAGGQYYAGLNFQHAPNGRVVSMAWQGGNRGDKWTGNFTFPVEHSLVATPNGERLRSTPVAELSTLISGERTWGNQVLQPKGVASLLDGVRLDTADLETVVDLRRTTAKKLTFRLHTNPDGWADREVVYDIAAGTLDGRPLPPRADGTVQIRMLVDRGQLEIYGNDGAYYRSLNVAFDSLPGGDGVGLVADGKVALRSTAFRSLSSSWVRGETRFATNITEPWYTVSGMWRDASAGKEGSSSGDGFYLSTRTGSDFVYEGDVQVVSGTAAALTFRSNQDASRHYTVNIDVDAQVVKLWRPGRDIASFRTTLERGRFHHLRVKAEGSRFQVWLDGSAEPVIDATDDTIASGQFGVNMFRGVALVNNANVSPLP